MSHPRIEEVSDDDVSDPEEMDPSAFDFSRPQHGSLQPAMDPSESRIDPAVLQQMLQSQQGQAQKPPGQMSDKDRERALREQRERTRSHQCLYPVYFDAGRSRDQGRRVGKELAVRNPLAKGIVDALQTIGNRERVPLQIVFEPTKCHPKDWANPGRVRVLIKKDGRAVNSKIQSKHHLYKLVAEHLQAHPTTTDDPMKFPIRGVPPPKDGKTPKPEIPRGWKMNSILPLHSPALTGGGVSENMFKDIMAEMGGQLPPGLDAGMGGAGGGGGSKKKDKKKK